MLKYNTTELKLKVKYPSFQMSIEDEGRGEGKSCSGEGAQHGVAIAEPNVRTRCSRRK